MNHFSNRINNQTICNFEQKPWCLEPLHIAWHNLIKANPELRKAVLLYMPINLVELKKFFKTIDMTFDNRVNFEFKTQSIGFGARLFKIKIE